MTEIKSKDKPSQTAGIGSNLGGPTSYPLGACIPIVNFEWVKKFLELNREGA